MAPAISDLHAQSCASVCMAYVQAMSMAPVIKSSLLLLLWAAPLLTLTWMKLGFECKVSHAVKQPAHPAHTPQLGKLS